MADIELVTVFEGPLWQADLLNGLLESEGIPTHLPDHTMKYLDPFITGPNPLAARIQVKAEDAELAVELLEAQKPRREKPLAGEAEEDEDEGSRSPEEDLELLASRTRWASLFTLIAGFLPLPFVLFYGITYLRACRTHRKTAARHLLTVLTFAWGILLAGIYIVVLVLIGTAQSSSQTVPH